MFIDGEKVFPVCSRCSNSTATPAHILDCIGAKKEDLFLMSEGMSRTHQWMSQYSQLCLLLLLSYLHSITYQGIKLVELVDGTHKTGFKNLVFPGSGQDKSRTKGQQRTNQSIGTLVRNQWESSTPGISSNESPE
ncbi:hypothetical protein LAZ67_7000463 [Cordylochernes scorpioides]|uniref:Uncharacterized protein n=1 Tax=Cordylochernes scorpioides TaxID=51811 RepID=A0ABY6KLK8_9ARAC|nr:hypothetical protein LAZ67_7000463 [Cordylochernes scorpioides]